MKVLFFLLLLATSSTCHGVDKNDHRRYFNWDVETIKIRERVKSVHDGDTLTLADMRRVRLLGIDAPEIGSIRRGRPAEVGAKASRNFLRGLLIGKTIDIYIPLHRSKDRYGRILGIVFIGEGCVNVKMVEKGHARIHWDFFHPIMVRTKWTALSP